MRGAGPARTDAAAERRPVLLGRRGAGILRQRRCVVLQRDRPDGGGHHHGRHILVAVYWLRMHNAPPSLVPAGADMVDETAMAALRAAAG